jgi:tetratricopeptide (TPR) repeat protein
MARVAVEKKDLETAKAKSAELRKQAEAVHNQFQIWQAHELDGLIAMKEKDFDRAVTELKQGNMQNPQNLQWLAQAYEAKGDAAQAQETYKRVAGFNSLNNLVYAFVRDDAQKMMAKK